MASNTPIKQEGRAVSRVLLPVTIFNAIER
jgi:hypothetical protein